MEKKRLIVGREHDYEDKRRRGEFPTRRRRGSEESGQAGDTVERFKYVESDIRKTRVVIDRS